MPVMFLLIWNLFFLFVICNSIDNTQDVFGGNFISLNCTNEENEMNYQIYTLSVDDESAIGDVMPYFDRSSNELFLIYLKDIWNDQINERHPWFGLKTKDFTSYSQISVGQLLNSSADPCSQDFSIGTGSIIQKDQIYYGFYTGHNPNSLLSCIQTKEGIMLATSSSLEKKFEKDLQFGTIYAPRNEDFDEKDNFRDPFVFYNSSSNAYVLLISARTSRGVIIFYKSLDLYHWTYEGIFYDGNPDTFFMMETPSIFEINQTYYLLFSDIDSKNVFYRKSKSFNGPWLKPNELFDRLDGTGFYAARTILNYSGNHYIFGWTNRYENNNDNGTWKWGGNLILHQFYQFNSTDDLAVTIPHSIQAYFEQFIEPIEKFSQWGFVENLPNDPFSFLLSSLLDKQVTNVIFYPINLIRYKISTTVSFSQSMNDFGLMFAICDDYNLFYSLRFIPSEQRFSFDKTNYSSLTPSTAPTSDVPFKLMPNTEYHVEILVENSMVVTYLDNIVALTARIYRARNNFWGIYADNSNAIFKNLSVTRP